MTAHRSREIRLRSRPAGMPAAGDFEVATVDVPELADGEVLVRNSWMSVDPYMRGRMSDRKSYVPPFAIGRALEGGAVGEVIASRAPELAIGDSVISMLGWRELALGSAKAFRKIDPGAMPIESFLGALGMPGMTAWVGLFRIAALKDGDTVFVSAAAGAVGSVVCQLAKAHGCVVIGSAGSPEKCRWLEETLGVDHTIDYKKSDVREALAKAAPKGIDVGFENVGGKHLEAAIHAMRPFGRIALCGMIEQYNDETPRPGPSNLAMLIGKRITMRGFIVSDHEEARPAFEAEMKHLVAAGKMKWTETVLEGIESAPRAMISLFEGANTGKMLVRLASEEENIDEERTR